MTDPSLTNAEWHEFQNIPDQGYSHRAWVDYKIAERLAAAKQDPFREALEHMLFNEYHRLAFDCGGDGWNEPLSESWTCGCDADEYTEDPWDGVSWVQTDPKCTDRPLFEDVVASWLKHLEDNNE